MYIFFINTCTYIACVQAMTHNVVTILETGAQAMRLQVKF